MTGEDLFTALGDALAVVQEHQDTPIEVQLARFGLEADAVRDVLAERIETYRLAFPRTEPSIAFVQGFVEGLLTASRL